MRHKKEIVNARGGNSLYCVHCDKFAEHPTRKVFGRPESQFDWRDKQGMKDAWESHKALAETSYHGE